MRKDPLSSALLMEPMLIFVDEFFKVFVKRELLSWQLSLPGGAKDWFSLLFLYGTVLSNQ